jgi:hypothetical protein
MRANACIRDRRQCWLPWLATGSRVVLFWRCWSTGGALALAVVPVIVHFVANSRHVVVMLKCMIDGRQPVQLCKFAWSYAGTSGKTSSRSGNFWLSAHHAVQSASVFVSCLQPTSVCCILSAAGHWTSAPARNTCASTSPNKMQSPRRAGPAAHQRQHSSTSRVNMITSQLLCMPQLSSVCRNPCKCSAQAFKDNRMNLAQEVYVFHLAFSG